jgi:hypothetical protein
MGLPNVELSFERAIASASTLVAIKPPGWTTGNEVS